MEVVESVMTSSDIAKVLHIPGQYVNNIAKACKLKPQLVHTRQGRKNYYTDDDFEIIKNYLFTKFKLRWAQIEIPELPKQKAEILIDGKTIEQLRKEHPLVHDDRFFNISFFPDVSID